MQCARHSSKTALRPVWTGRQEYSRKSPNITGWIGTQNGWIFFVNHNSGALYAVEGRSDIRVSIEDRLGDLVSPNLNFDASLVSSLYQKDLSEVRVNALFGLNLIRAF